MKIPEKRLILYQTEVILIIADYAAIENIDYKQRRPAPHPLHLPARLSGQTVVQVQYQ